MKITSFLSFLLLFSASVFAQSSASKADVILKMNGDEVTGKVMEITDSLIAYSYAGETLVYKVKKSEVMKITFASGRIEVFNKPAPASPAPQSTVVASQVSSLDEHHNKVAILPFAVIKDGQKTVDEISLKVQTECYSNLNSHAGVYTYIDPRTSNALLIKAGVTKDNMEGYTMSDLCNILNVEYVVDGIISINKTTQTSSQTGSATVTDKNDPKTSNDKKSVSTSSYSTSAQNFQTSINLSIYNDKGVGVYTKERQSFWSTQDAYKSALDYLLKRSPLYQK